MSNKLMKSCIPVFLTAASMAMLLICSAAKGQASGESIIKCDMPGLSSDYIEKVCKPLQISTNSLLSGPAKAADPIIITEKLNMTEYRSDKVNAVIAASKDSKNLIPIGSEPTGSKTSSDNTWFISQ